MFRTDVNVDKTLGIVLLSFSKWLLFLVGDILSSETSFYLHEDQRKPCQVPLPMPYIPFMGGEIFSLVSHLLLGSGVIILRRVWLTEDTHSQQLLWFQIGSILLSCTVIVFLFDPVFNNKIDYVLRCFFKLSYMLRAEWFFSCYS